MDWSNWLFFILAALWPIVALIVLTVVAVESGDDVYSGPFTGVRTPARSH